MMPGWHHRRLRRLDRSATTRARRDLAAALARRPIRLVACLAAAALAGGAGGPVGGVIAGTYTGIVLNLIVRRRRDAAIRTGALSAMDLLVTLASELRSGADPAAATGWATAALRGCGPVGTRLAARVRVAMRVAEASGARLADLLDRLENDARSAARARDLAQAQAAGAEATAWLLAALPVGGIALGTGIGAHPLHDLLHTPLGAACAGAALALQAIGLAWTRRLAAGAVSAA